MTVTIKKSMISPFGDQFGVAAAAYASELKAWRAHMDRVTQDEKNGVPRDQAHHPYPAPRAPLLVEAVINEAGEVDFAVEDDGPTSDQILEAKKDALTKKVVEITDAAALAILPRAKAILINMKIQDIHDDDAWRATLQQALVSEKISVLENAQSKLAAAKPAGLIKRLLNINPEADALGRDVKSAEDDVSEVMKPLDDMVRFHDENRPEEQTRFLRDHKKKQAQIRAIHRWSAQVQSDIDDLTIDTVDAWDMPPLPT